MYVCVTMKLTQQSRMEIDQDEILHTVCVVNRTCFFCLDQKFAVLLYTKNMYTDDNH